jgi:sigma-B regulation protein RsbU (phosphoserine phosphatase)
VDLRRAVAATVLLAVALVAAIGALALLQRERDLAAAHAETRLAAHERAWRDAVARTAERLERRLEPLAARAAAAAAGRPLAAVADVLQGMEADGLAAGIDAMQAFDLSERVLLPAWGAAARGPMMDAPAALGAVGAGRPAFGVRRFGDGVAVVAAVPIPGPAGIAGLLIGARGVGSALDELSAFAGTAVVLVDDDGRVLASPAAPGPAGVVLDLVAGTARGIEQVRMTEQVYDVATLPLLDLEGRRVGAQRWILEITDRSWQADLDRAVAVLALLAAAAAVAAAVLLWLRAAFRPLEANMTALLALSHGDTSIEILGADRKDEVGRAARALKALRAGQLELQRTTDRGVRLRRRQLHFIDGQLDRLGETLDEDARAALQDDRSRIRAAAGPAAGADTLDALAVGFRVMVERVSDQNLRLRRTLAEKDDALREKEKAAELEQQVAAAMGVQERMVPAALPEHPSVAVRARLVHGAGFGGDLLDFFWLDPPRAGEDRRPRRLALLLASVSGEGLTSAFLAVSARALVRALAPSAASPGACLSRVSDLLIGDNEERLEVRAFLGVLDVEDGVLVAARAGMPAPLVAARPGDARPLDVAGAPPLALRPGARVPDATVEIARRSALVLASPGTAAAVGGADGERGLAVALGSAADLDADPLLAALADAVSAGGPPASDASLIVARLTGE